MHALELEWFLFTYVSEASSSLIKVSFTGGKSCLIFSPLTYGAESFRVSFNCSRNILTLILVNINTLLG